MTTSSVSSRHSHPGYPDEFRLKAIQPLPTGPGPTAISSLVESDQDLSGSRLQVTPVAVDTQGLIDKRRLYDDTFKAEVKRQIKSGIPILRLHQSLGISQVTLHKWKREKVIELAAPPEPVQACRPAVEEPLDTSPAGRAALDVAAGGPSSAGLLVQLRAVEAERDTLKKALRILLRPD